MRWTLGILLLAAAGCGYRNDTKMVACPESGCPHHYTGTSPQGLRYSKADAPPVVPTAGEEALHAPPLRPLPDKVPPPPTPPPATP